MQIWKMLGYLAFAVIFVLLAMHPRRHPGLWELAFLHYGALFLAAVLPGVPGKVVVADAVIAIVVGGCYFLTKGHLAWRVVEPTAMSSGDSRVGTTWGAHPMR
jgi:hypothetical protein